MQVVINGAGGVSRYDSSALRRRAIKIALERKQPLLSWHVEVFEATGRVRLVAVIDAGAGTTYQITEAM